MRCGDRESASSGGPSGNALQFDDPVLGVEDQVADPFAGAGPLAATSYGGQ